MNRLTSSRPHEGLYWYRSKVQQGKATSKKGNLSKRAGVCGSFVSHSLHYGMIAGDSTTSPPCHPSYDAKNIQLTAVAGLSDNALRLPRNACLINFIYQL